MEKAKLVLDVIQKLLKVAEDLKNLSGSIQEVCTAVSDGLSDTKSEEPKKAEPSSRSMAQIV